MDLNAYNSVFKKYRKLLVILNNSALFYKFNSRYLYDNLYVCTLRSRILWRLADTLWESILSFTFPWVPGATLFKKR